VRTARRLSNLGLYEAWRLAPAGPPDAEQRLAEALWFLETGRGQAFARGLLNREALLQAELPRELRAACTAARTRVDAELRRIANRALPGGRDSLDAAYLDLETLNRRIQREAGRVAQLVLPEPVDLAPLRAALPEGSALVLYQLSEDRALVLVVTASSAALLDLGSAKALAEAAESYLRLASAAGGEEGVEAEAGRARQLYDLLLRPLEPALAGARRLLISPDRALSFLSFEALLRADASGPARALERWEMSYVPSGTVLSMLAGEFRDAKRGERLLALGDPHYPGEASAAPTARRDAVLRGFGPLERLPASAEETRAIAALFPEGRSRLLLREDATAAKLTAALAEGGGRLAAVHFACHGFLDPERPRLTGLVLAGGEVLGLDDLYRLRIPADLAVLSACETGKGKLVTGDGVIGLVRGFFFAGVPRVVVSNWKVSDAGTRPLMVAFYREMLERGRAPAAALREAKLAMLRAGGAGARPSAWAAFVLWGLPD
jgi:CHAT domain-containing protein